MGACQSAEPQPVGLPDEVMRVVANYKSGEGTAREELSTLRTLLRALIEDDVVGDAIREELAIVDQECEIFSESCRVPLQVLNEQSRIDSKRLEKEAREAAELEAAIKRDIEAALAEAAARAEEEKKVREEELRQKQEEEERARMEELRREQEEAARRLEVLRRTPPPVSVLEVYKASGNRILRSLKKWQSRTIVLEAGILYYYESSNLVDGRITYPYGKNIKGYLSMRNVLIYTDFEDMDPQEIIIRKLSESEAHDHHHSRKSRGTEFSCIADEDTVAGMREYDIVIKPHLESTKMDVVGDLEKHINFAMYNHVRTPKPENNERIAPLQNVSGLASLTRGRYVVKDRSDSTSKSERVEEKSGDDDQQATPYDSLSAPPTAGA